MQTYRIIINQYGATLGKQSERLIIKSPLPPQMEDDGSSRQLPLPIFQECEQETTQTNNVAPPPPPDLKPGVKRRSREKTEIPFFRISELIIASKGVSLSTDLIEELTQRGISISFITPGGKPYANLSSPMLNATVITRREQLKSYHDQRGLELVKTIVSAKLKNQSHCLKYFAKYLKDKDAQRYKQIRQISLRLKQIIPQVHSVEGECIDNTRGQLMGMEGSAGRLYWEGVRQIFANEIDFNGREHRGTANPVNAALNYGYGILYARLWAAVLYAGMEPFAGFLHVDRPGKPSLILDLIEEFRQPVVDRTVIACFNLGQTIRMTSGLLDENSRKLIAEKVNERLETPAPYNGQKLKISSIIQAQARQAAAFLRGDKEYKPFIMRW